MNILLLKGYNNYFNRIVKKENTVSAYKSASTSFLEYSNVNFDPNDGISTSLIVGSEAQQIVTTVGDVEVKKILDFEEAGSPDYLVVYKVVENNPVIHSRWFINECVRTRAGQYKLALKRDVLVDFNIQVMNSPCFVEKGFINDVNNPLLLNAEGMSFNQIKKDEKFIQDETHCAWIVGYLHKNLDATKLSNVNPITYTIPTPTGNIPNATAFDWEPCITYNNLDGTTTAASKNCLNWNKSKSQVRFRTQFQNESWPTYANASLRLGIGLDYSIQVNDVDIWDFDWDNLNSNALLFKDGNQFHWIDAKAAKELGRDIADHTANWAYVKQMFDRMVNDATASVTSGDNVLRVEEDVSKYNNTYIKKNNKVYLLTIGQGTPKTYNKVYTGNDGVANDYLSSLYFGKEVYGVTYYLTRNTDNPGRNKINISLSGQTYTITAQEVIVGDTLTYNLPISDYRNQCSDALYDMFCMPVNPAVFGLDVETNEKVRISYRPDALSSFQYLDLNSTASENQLAMALKIATKLGAGDSGSLIYDLQLLPYCPMDNLYVSYNTLYKETTINCAFNYLDANDGTVILNGSNKIGGVIFYPKRANFTKDVTFSIPNEHNSLETKLIKNPVFEYSGSQEDGYYWYWCDVAFEGIPAEDVYSMELTIDIDDYDPSDYAYGGWLLSGSTTGGTLYFGIPISQYVTPPSTKTFSGEVTLEGLWVVPDDAVDKKVNNECDFYRITSPNYNGMFEFKNTKLQDGLQTINIDCTYKPFTPYIKLNPNLFGSLYSDLDFNDSTGLICGGDFSIPMLSDAMVNYELQNRNYQAIFNRNIQNLDVNQRIAKEQQQFQGVVGAITGSIGGGVGGALAGAKAGPYGAIAGAALGLAGGTAAGIIGYEKDRKWLEEQQTEARDFAIDNFTYQLGNIQALPQSVTKSSPLSFNNKVWPILEYFSCTDREKEVLRDKIKYDGMTIMAIGQLLDYSVDGCYLKGKMIRINDLEDDSHVAQAIYEEVNKGFYEGE